MNEYDNIVEMFPNDAASVAVGAGMDEDNDAEKARRAIELSKATGVSPNAIYGDVEGFERQHKGTLASEIVRKNPNLAEYMLDDPMNARLSLDDLGNLDAADQSVTKFRDSYETPFFRRFAYSIAKGIEQGVGKTVEGAGYLAGVQGTQDAGKRIAKRGQEATQEAVGEETAKEFEDYASQTVGGTVGTMVGSMAPIVFGAAVGAASGMGALTVAAIQMGLMGGAQLEEEARAKGASEGARADAFVAGFAINSILGILPFEYLSHAVKASGGQIGQRLVSGAISAGIFAGSNEATEALNKVAARFLYDPQAAYSPDENRIMASLILGGLMGFTFKSVRAYSDAGKEPPLGLHPLLDSISAEQAKIDLANLDQSLRDAQQSSTREADPERFASYLRRITDGKIGVNIEAIDRIYGDKEALPDDGKLGWVAGINEQIAQARETGGDVQIPLADWLAHVDPQVAKELRDDIRVRLGQATVNEQKIALEVKEAIKAYHGSGAKFEAFDSKYMGSGEGAQAYAYGHYLAESKGVAESYAVPRQTGTSTVAGGIGPFANAPLLDNSGKHVYKATIKREPNEFLDWEAELDSQPAGKKILKDMDPEFKASLEDYLEQHDQLGELESLTGQQFHRLLERWASEDNLPGVTSRDEPHMRREASEYIKNLGVPGVRFLDQASRNKVAPDKDARIADYKETLEEQKATLADYQSRDDRWKNNNIEHIKSVENNIKRLEDGIAELESAAAPTRNYVVFDEADIEVTHHNNEPVPPRPATLVEAVRQSSALEPLFAIGDRKLELIKAKTLPDEGFGAGHVFEFQNEKGQKVGFLSISEMNNGTQLSVDMISGTGNFDANSFGPSLIRDVFRQLKAQFPNATEIIGFRVSGARKAANKVEQKGEMSIKFEELDTPKGMEFVDEISKGQLKEGGEWVGNSPNIEAYVRDTALFTEQEQALNKAVNEALERIVPKGVEVQAADQLRRKGTEDGPLGAYTTYTKFRSLLSWTFEDFNALGTVRHEAMHHLREYNFFTPDEWNVLRRAALSEKWLEKYNINKRYEGLSIEGKLEEAIADGFKKWWLAKKQVPPELKPIFERIKDLLETIKAKVKEVLGYEPTWEQLFEKIESGEIGRREPGKPRTRGAFEIKESRPEQLEMADMTRMKDRDAFEKGTAIGMTADQYKRYQKKIAERQAEDLLLELAKAEKAQKRRQSREWKEESDAMWPEVAADIIQRPDVSADRFLRDGILGGQQVERVRLGAEFLSPEQQAALPKSYWNKTGLAPDALAGLFGFESGNALVESLTNFEAQWKASGVRREEFIRRIINNEVQRRMEEKHGKLEENILAEAKDQALSETQLQLLHEETLALAVQAGAQFSIPKDTFVAQIQENFGGYKLDTINSDRLLADAGRAGRAAEMALLKDDPAEAFRQKQRQFVAVTHAKEALRLEKEQERFGRLERRYEKSQVKGTEQEFTNYIQSLMQQAGYKVKLTPDQIQGNFDHHGNVPLSDFVQSTNSNGWDLYVAPDYLGGQSKSIEAMTVDEWRDLRDTIQSLDHVGRAVQQIELAGVKADFAEWKAGVIENITSLPPRDPAKQRRGGNWFFRWDASIMRMEEMVKDLDLRKELGPLFEGLIAPMMRSKAKEFDMITELSKHFENALGRTDKAWRQSLADTIPQDFIIDPATRVPYDLTRENMIQIMLNWGTESNRMKFNRGYASLLYGRKATKEEAIQYGYRVQQLLNSHARAKDWQFVEQMWEPFRRWRPEADRVSRNVSGIAPKWIPEADVVTPFGIIKGGYWPVKYDRLGSDMEVIRGGQDLGNGPLGNQYFRATTARNYLKERTGYVDFVDITTSLEQAAGTMQQTIHDIAFRDAVVQAAKIIYDKQIRAATRKHYGVEYEPQLEAWLKRIANPNTVDNHGIAAINSFLRRVRINLVGHALPLNLKVILSPDIGRPDPRVWVAFEADRANNVKLAMEQSNEIRHMVYNMDRDYRESLERNFKEGDFSAFQRKAVEWGFKPMMKISQEFRMATFVHEWQKAKAKGHTDSQASQVADSVVREQHGAASIVDLPSVMASSESMKMLTMFYGFFNTMYNWQRQMPGQVRREEYENLFWTAAGSVGVGAAFGAGLFNKASEDDSWWKIIGKALVLQPLQTVPILRDAANFYIEGNRPSAPVVSLMQAASSLYTDAKRKSQGKPMLRPIQNTANVIGLATGLPLAQIGRTGEFAYDVATGQSRPKNMQEWIRGIIHGEIKLKK